MDNDTPPPGARRANGQFAKGVSGRVFDRRGKTRGQEMEQAAQEAYRRASPIMLKRLMELIDGDDTPPSVRMAAIKEGLNRAHGKPALMIQAAPEPTDQFIDLSGLEVDDLRKLTLAKLEAPAEETSEGDD